MGSKEDLWHEIMDRRIFCDETHKDYEWAWRSIESLKNNNRITQVDLFHIMALIDIATSYADE